MFNIFTWHRKRVFAKRSRIMMRKANIILYSSTNPCYWAKSTKRYLKIIHKIDDLTPNSTCILAEEDIMTPSAFFIGFTLAALDDNPFTDTSKLSSDARHGLGLAFANLTIEYQHLNASTKQRKLYHVIKRALIHRHLINPRKIKADYRFVTKIKEAASKPIRKDTLDEH